MTDLAHPTYSGGSSSVYDSQNRYKRTRRKINQPSIDVGQFDNSSGK